MSEPTPPPEDPESLNDEESDAGSASAPARAPDPADESDDVDGETLLKPCRPILGCIFDIHLFPR